MEIKAQNLCGAYRNTIVLKDVDLTIASGTVTVLLGSNGSGKSTLLKILAKTLSPAAGKVFVGGKDIRSWPRRELAQKLAFLPQNHTLPGELTVAELTALGRFPHHRNPFGILTGEDRKKINQAMESTGILPLADRRLSSLSGGEVQRARLAMAIAREPEIMLLDEPTTFLDISSQYSFVELLKRLNREHSITIAAVLHDLNLAAALADDLIFLKDRRIFAAGSTADVLTAENIQAVFGLSARIAALESGRLHCII